MAVSHRKHRSKMIFVCKLWYISCHIFIKIVSIVLKLISTVEYKSRSISGLFAERSDSKWPTGGHFELLKMRGDLKQALPIFKDVNANDHFMIHNESRHPQLHADRSFRISDILIFNEIIGHFVQIFFEKIHNFTMFMSYLRCSSVHHEILHINRIWPSQTNY